MAHDPLREITGFTTGADECLETYQAALTTDTTNTAAAANSGDAVRRF